MRGLLVFFPLLSIVIVVLAGVYDSETLVVILPIFAIVQVGLIFLYAVYRNTFRTYVVFEIGVLYLALVSLYGIYPLCTYLANGMMFTSFSDDRLYAMQPSPAEVSNLAWCYVLYIAAFALAYVLARGVCPPIPRMSFSIHPALPAALTVCYVLIKLFFVVVRYVYSLPTAESYLESYLVYKNLPLILQQLVNHLSGVSVVIQISLLSLLVLRFKEYKVIIFLWLGIEVASNFVNLGARTNLFMLLLSFSIAFNFLVKKIAPVYAAAGVVTVFILFIVLGLLRNGELIAQDELAGLFTRGNEFEALFANALHVSQLSRLELSEIFPRLYVSDFLRLIPQQFLPFEKIDIASWYVNTFYPQYAQSGGGYGFGVIAESMAGLGRVDAVWRAAVIGVIFGRIHRRFATQQQSLWSYVFYVWCTVLSYLAFRETTFCLIALCVFHFMPVLVVGKFLERYSSGFGFRHGFVRRGHLRRR